MDFELSEEQKELIERARVFFEPYAADTHKWYAKPQPQTLMEANKRLANAGFLGMGLSEDVGGLGVPTFDTCLVIEEASRHDPNTAYLMRNATAGPTAFIAFLGTRQQQEKYVKPVLEGRAVTAICITEPEAGSDATALKTTAKRTSSGWRLNGGKHYITHAHVANCYVVYAKFKEADDSVIGIGALLVEPGMQGVTLGPGVETMDGGRVYQLYFDDVEVPAENVLIPGKSDKAHFKRLMSVYNLERLSGQFRWLGVMQRAFDMAREHALTRRQFGRPIIEFQAIQLKLADMKVRLEAARLLLYRAAARVQQGLPRREDVSMAKILVQDSLKFVLDEAIQIHGGMGYTRELPLEYFQRLARLGSIGGGTVEIHRIGLASILAGRKLGVDA